MTITTFTRAMGHYDVALVPGTAAFPVVAALRWDCADSRKKLELSWK
ncbi:hypothetical protein [Butyrivibrio sp. AE3009]|nr:hypothetical protein [Butyrivibrio sp. AE3009]